MPDNTGFVGAWLCFGPESDRCQEMTGARTRKANEDKRNISQPHLVPEHSLLLLLSRRNFQAFGHKFSFQTITKRCLRRNMAPKRRKGDGDDTENDAKRAKTGDQTSGEPAEPEKAAPKKKKPLPKHFADVQPLVDEAKKRDGDDKSKKATDDDMVEKLALHLASTPQMIEWIKSPTQLSQINVSFWFLANVHLEHRWKRYQDIQVSTEASLTCCTGI